MKALHIVIASALITSAAIKAAPALAETPDVAVSYVRTADLDLQSDAGRRELDHRLVTAAREVCGTASNVDLEGKNEVRRCIETVLSKARGEGEQLAANGGAVIAITAAR